MNQHLSDIVKTLHDSKNKDVKVGDIKDALPKVVKSTPKASTRAPNYTEVTNKDLHAELVKTCTHPVMPIGPVVDSAASIPRAATIVGPLNEGIRPFLKIPLLEFHKSW